MSFLKKAFIKFGDWERKKLDQWRKSNAEKKKLDAQLREEEKKIARKAYIKERKVIAKERGKRKARAGKGKGSGLTLRMPNLWDGFEGQKKKKKE